MGNLATESVIFALDSDEGRKALAQAMTDPIKQSLNYQNIGRKLVMAEHLPEKDYLNDPVKDDMGEYLRDYVLKYKS